MIHFSIANALITGLFKRVKGPFGYRLLVKIKNTIINKFLNV